MYARLAFSVAAHVNADVMIVDETLAVGDAAFTQKCMRFFEEFKKRGTILFVSHDTAAVNRLCHRAIWLESGRMRMEGPAKDVTEAYLASTYAESTGDGQVRVLSGVRRDAVKVPAADIPNPPKPVVSVFDFNPDSAGFGAGGARISNVRLRALGVNPSAPLRGGEEIELTVEAELTQPLDNPIIGFLVKDRLGQVLFNRNTFYTHPALTYRRDLENYVSAKFQFIMPMLDNGDYSVTAAIADGTPQSNVQQHWLHDALFFQVSQADHGRGLIGVQMLGVEVDFSSSAN